MSITLTHVKGPEAGSPNKQLHHSDISVPLPAVLGRGALLKCAEKKVSRRHATLDWDDDGVVINSVHLSPTFVIVSGTKQKLSHGESAVLGHGDTFGLLDDAFWFRVTLENGKKSCDKENALIGNTEAKSENENIKSKSIQENKNDALNQNKQIITNNKFEDSKEDKLKATPSKIAKEEVVSESIKKILSFPNSTFSSNSKLDAMEGSSGISSKVASTLNEEATSSNGVAKVSLTLYTQNDLNDAVNDRKRTLPSWMSGSTSSTNKATSSKNDSSSINAVQHGRKNNIPAQKKQNTSRLKDDSSIKNSNNIDEKSERKNSPKKSPVKHHKMRQNDDEEIEKNKDEREEKLEKKKSPLKRSPKASPAKKTPSKFHGLSQDVNDDEISEEYDTEIKNNTSDNLHNLSDDGGRDNNKHTPQKKNPSPRKFITPDKNSPSENEDNDAEFESNKTKNTVGSRLAGVTTATSTTNTSTGNAGGRGRKRAAPRGSCSFGSQCYRKNPQHKDEYAHPGDSDYNEDDSEDEDGDGDGDDDEREECEFGIDCYRKNPQHRKQFKHTRVPQPQRNAKRKGRAKKRGSDESESDEYDSDDPFLNDDSSDDYAPTDSGSDSNIEDNDVEDEDTGRLLKEGKKFVRNN